MSQHQSEEADTNESPYGADAETSTVPRGEIQFAEEATGAFKRLVRESLRESDFIEIENNEIFALKPNSELSDEEINKNPPSE